jgi:hypothetical protein
MRTDVFEDSLGQYHTRTALALLRQNGQPMHLEKVQSHRDLFRTLCGDMLALTSESPVLKKLAYLYEPVLIQKLDGKPLQFSQAHVAEAAKFRGFDLQAFPISDTGDLDAAFKRIFETGAQRYTSRSVG